MRDPSIHITESRLKAILKEIMPDGVDVRGLAEYIIRYSKKYTLNHRKISVNTKRVEKKAREYSRNEAAISQAKELAGGNTLLEQKLLD